MKSEYKINFVIFSLLLFLFTILGMNCKKPQGKMGVRLVSYPDSLISNEETLKVTLGYTISKNMSGEDFKVTLSGSSGDGEFNCEPVILNDLSYTDSMRYTTIQWIGFCRNGLYTLTGGLHKTSGDPKKVEDKSETPIPIKNPYGHLLKIWCGDMRYGNITDTVHWPAAYPVYVKIVKDTMWYPAVNGETIRFSCNPGLLTDSLVISARCTLAGQGWHIEEVNGLAGTRLILNTNNFTHRVYAQYKKIPATVFRIYCESDTEICIDTLGIYEHWNGDTSQIRGDGYWDVNDPDPSKKNLKLEVDYDSTQVRDSVVIKALDLLKDSIYPKVNIYITYDINNTFISGTIDRHREKELLKTNRHLDRDIGKGYLHLLFASSFDTLFSPLG